MLKKILSSNINSLKKELIKKIKDYQDFFKTPYIIFNNQNMEKWFKTSWIKEEKEILMNVKFMNFNDALYSFGDGLYNLATTSDINYSLLSLCLNGKVNDNYIFNDDKTIDSSRLVSYCSEMTKVFMDGELNKLNIEDKVYNLLKEELKKNNILLINDFIKNSVFKNINAPIYIFNVRKLEKSYLDYINKLSENNEVYLFDLNINLEIKNDEKIRTHFIKAPSVLREVEVIHSKICELLKEANYSDITIYAPNVGEYGETIARVFKQSEVSDNGIKEKYLNIPYVIKTSMTRDTNITKALTVMLDIIRKGFYTRLDIYKLASNGLIKTVRDISFEDLEVIVEAMINMNLYRSIDQDFIKGKKRLLAAKLVGAIMTLDNAISIDGTDLIPYGNMNLSDDIVWKFSNLIDDLDSLIKLKDDNDFLNKIMIEFDKWFSIKDYNDMETNKLYSKITNIIEAFKNINNVNIDIIFNYLIENSKISKSTKGEILTSGITFLDINDNVVIPNKYVFLMGMSSNAFPREDKRTEFYNLDTISNEELDKETFNKIINNGEELYFSYTSLDIKKDSPFYPTILFDKLIENNLFIVPKKYNEEDKKYEIVMEEISLDETRPYSELYTRREFKKKEHLLKLFDNSKQEDKIITSTLISYNKQNIIKLNDLGDFLKEPLIAKAERLMKTKEDEYNKLKTEYNNFSFDSLNKTIITSTLIEKLLIDVSNNAKNEIDAIKYIDNIDGKDIKEELVASMKIAQNVFGDLVIEDIIARAKDVVRDYLTSISAIFELVNIPELILSNKDESYTLTESKNYYRFVCGNSRTYAQLKDLKGKFKSLEGFINTYLFSLMDVARIDDLDEDKEYDIYLFGDKENTKRFKLSKRIAKEYLNKYYNLYNDYTNNAALPIVLLENKDIDEINDLFKKLTETSSWKYAVTKDLFDKYTDLGYSVEDFKETWNNVCLEQLKLFELLKDEEEAKDNE